MYALVFCFLTATWRILLVNSSFHRGVISEFPTPAVFVTPLIAQEGVSFTNKINTNIEPLVGGYGLKYLHVGSLAPSLHSRRSFSPGVLPE